MKHHRVKPDTAVDLRDHDAGDTGDVGSEAEAAGRTAALLKKLDVLQERLYAEGGRALLVVLQGIDAAGKDGTIRHVMGGVNPQGCTVTSFKEPTPLEKAHDFLWRIHAACPAAGTIAIFNRSHYEDVIVTRVHGWITKKEAQSRLELIRDFEKILADRGIRVVKFLLHLSEGEQKKRLLERVDDPGKRWKFSPDDLKERAYWDAYQKAFGEALSATSTKEAPWYVVPADHKWYRNLVVADVLVDTLEEMDPRIPEREGMDWVKLRRGVSRS